MAVKISDNLYCIQVNLPNNPLRYLNSYVFAGLAGARNLIIDTGFNTPGCLDELLGGVNELGLELSNTDVFLSHAHSDHTGNAFKLQTLGCRILMGKTDYDILNTDTWPERKARMLREGMPEAVLARVFANNPAVLYMSEPFCAEFVGSGDILNYGGYSLEAVLTPGHTPGQMCLIDRPHKLFFTADHILFDITPNINSRGEGTDALGTYIESLRAVRDFDAEIILPSHRTAGGKSVSQRVDELICHHMQRLGETKSIICEHPGSSAYEIAGLMQWHIRAQNWDEFPAGQKWFAVSEALAHIDYLLRRTEIMKYTDCDGTVRYGIS